MLAIAMAIRVPVDTFWPTSLLLSASAQGPTQSGPIQRWAQVELLLFFLPSSHEAPVCHQLSLPKAYVFPFEQAPLLTCLILMVASVAKNPTISLWLSFVDGFLVSRRPPAVAHAKETWVAEEKITAKAKRPCMRC